ncbi:MAG: hypothetical protein ACUVQI_00655 [Thermochromatium sp.]
MQPKDGTVNEAYKASPTKCPFYSCHAGIKRAFNCLFYYCPLIAYE